MDIYAGWTLKDRGESTASPHIYAALLIKSYPTGSQDDIFYLQSYEHSS